MGLFDTSKLGVTGEEEIMDPDATYTERKPDPMLPIAPEPQEHEADIIEPTVPGEHSLQTPKKQLDIDDALQSRRDAQMYKIMSGAGEKFLEAGARRAGGEYKADYKIPDAIAGLMSQDVTDIKERPALELASAKSDVSSVYRDFIKNKLGLEIPDTVSAETLEKLLPTLKALSGKHGGALRFERITDENGVVKVVALDPISGEVVREVGQAGFAGQFRTDPFGNIIGMNPAAGFQGKGVDAGPKVIVPSARAPVTSMTPTQVTNFRPDEKHRKALDDEKTRLDTLTKSSNDAINAASKIKQAIDSGSKMALAVVKTQMPRMAGEVGNLNQMEQEAWKGSQAALDRVNQYLENITTSELTADNKKELQKLLNVFGNTAKQNRDAIFEGSASSLARIHSIPPEFTKQALGRVAVRNGANQVALPKSYQAGKILNIKGTKYQVNKDGKTASKVE